MLLPTGELVWVAAKHLSGRIEAHLPQDFSHPYVGVDVGGSMNRECFTYLTADRECGVEGCGRVLGHVGDGCAA